MKEFFIIIVLFSFADKSFEMDISPVSSSIAAASPSSNVCEKLPPYISLYGPDRSMFLNSFSKKSDSTCTAKESVKFICKASNDNTFYDIDFYNRTSVDQLNKMCPLAFVAHGFLSDCSCDWMVELLKVWTDAECINVCCVDWGIWSQCHYYHCKNSYVQWVGEYLAGIIKFSTTAYGMHTKSLMGHSLGAHVIGECGRNVNNPQVAECYSIDGAGPGYTNRKTIDESRCIKKSDCERVITLCCERKFFGTDKLLGHVNIFVNDGTNQPQCGYGNFTCDHLSCPIYVIESLRKDRSWNYTLTNIDTNTPYVFDINAVSEYPDGNYAMTTSSCYPYAIT